MHTSNELKNDIVELQEKLTFCEDTLNTLNDIVTRQELEIRKLWDANRLLKQQLNDVRNMDGDNASGEAPPPHY